MRYMVIVCLMVAANFGCKVTPNRAPRLGFGDMYPLSPDVEEPEVGPTADTVVQDNTDMEGGDTGEECPVVSRSEILTELFERSHDKTCLEMYGLLMPCPDLDPGSEESCQWGVFHSLGIMGPFPEGDCRPDQPVILAEFFKVLVVYLDALVEGAECEFFEPSYWYYRYASSAVHHGWISCSSDIYPGDIIDQCFLDEVLSKVTFPLAGLKARVEDVDPGGEVQEGASETLSARYFLQAHYEGYWLDRITVINDRDGIFDQPEDTIAIDLVWVSCPVLDGSGDYYFYFAELFDGQATFEVECEVPMNGVLELQLAFDVWHLEEAGPELIGETFRLGLLEVGNTVETFKAVGIATGRIETFPDGDEITGSSAINMFEVVESPPPP